MCEILENALRKSFRDRTIVSKENSTSVSSTEQEALPCNRWNIGSQSSPGNLLCRLMAPSPICTTLPCIYSFKWRMVFRRAHGQLHHIIIPRYRVCPGTKSTCSHSVTSHTVGNREIGTGISEPSKRVPIFVVLFWRHLCNKFTKETYPQTKISRSVATGRVPISRLPTVCVDGYTLKVNVYCTSSY